MKILYISQYYPPETPAPAARASELARIWTTSGHRVTVLTGFPNHPTGKVHPQYRSKFWHVFMKEDMDAVEVRRTWLIPLPNRKSWERVLNYTSFFVSSLLRGTLLSRPDVVIASSPQLLVGLSGLIIAKLKGVPFIFEVRDLWPESLEAVGVGSSRSIFVRLLRAIAGLIYRNAAHIVVVTAPFKEHLTTQWKIPAEKITVVPNGVDHGFFCPQTPSDSLIREFGLQNRTVASYIGTIGNAHGIENLVAAAEFVNVACPQILFLVIGEGAEKQKLVDLVTNKGLTNIRIFSGQPRSRVPSIIAASDICLVLLKEAKLFETVVPTKMLEFMSCGCPTVGAVAGEAARILEEAHAGIAVKPGDAREIARAIVELSQDHLQRKKLGANGRDYVVRNLSRERTAHEYLELIRRVAAMKTGQETPDLAKVTNSTQ